MKILTEKDYHTNAWAGGATTELFLYPAGASYQKRDFLFRLSSATVAAERSVFTLLPGIYRILVCLKGRLHLTHGGNPAVALGPFEQDAFDGGEQTVSEGRGTDLNLMLRGCTGRIIRHALGGVAQFPQTDQFRMFYCARGRFQAGAKPLPEHATAIESGSFPLMGSGVVFEIQVGIPQ